MTFANVLLGLVIGLPMMIAFGPISVLLFDQGLERGVRSAAPAAIGVASADLTFSVFAAIAGATIATVLAPVEHLMVLAAVGVLAWIAFAMGRSAITEMRLLGDTATRSGSGEDRSANRQPAAAAPFVGLSGSRLAGAFYGLTMVNPVTIVLFASVVVAGTAGVGTPGWAVGMFLASLIAHGGFVVLGGVLGATLSTVATARLRLAAALFMVGLAVHFLLQA
uniref:Lysine exporter protein (LYSE/YGGA) n=1 Tax=uncultured bacterium A1Q1_fos_2286 TaxID=1256566 RepID=L7VYW1_9BACT|nr:lysine exporter protein (LYSE/YGGA) [uncultured bacterium A1Q1_fos_2286]